MAEVPQPLFLKVDMSLSSNAKWNAFSQVFKVIVQLVNIVYLTKIIAPEEYGIMAMASVVVSLGVLLRDLGTTAAIIQQKKLTEEIKNTVFWINCIMGAGICICICLISPYVASFYEQPKLTSVLILISFMFPVSSSSASHLALMERESRFKEISLIEILTSFLSIVAAVTLAKQGFGIYSLVGQALTLSVTSAILFWFFSGWVPSLKIFIVTSELKRIFSFSANLSLFNLINYISRSGDSFIIGKYMSASVLGSYNLAYRIMLFPLQSLTFVASRSLYPVLSKHQDDNVEILRKYELCVFFILMITAPLMTGIAILSSPFINVFFGANWQLTAEILKWLAPTAIIQSVLSTAGSVFTAKGRTDILFRLGCVGTILQFSSFIIGVQYNIVFFAFCYFIANLLNFFPVMYFLLRLISGSFFSFILKVTPIFFSTFFMLVIMVVLIRYSSYFSAISSLKSLVLISLVGFFSYFFCIFTLSRHFRQITLGSVLKGKFKH